MQFSFHEEENPLADTAKATASNAIDTPAAHDALPDCDIKEFLERRLQSGSNELYAKTLAYMERYLLTRVLQETRGNQSKAAKILGITRGKIRDRIAAFGLKLEKEIRLEEGQNESPNTAVQESNRVLE